MASRSTKKYNQAAGISKHYGFSVEDKLKVEKESIKLAKAAKKEPKYFDPNMPTIEEVVQLTLDYKEWEKDNGSKARLQYFDKSGDGDYTKHRKRTGENQIMLNIQGVEGSVAEALMIKTISVILSENGYKNHSLHLNNMGGKETQTQFNREATAFFRKNISLLNSDCRQYFKKNVHTLITVGGDQCKIIKEHAPEPMDFLDEESRTRFTELIERVEMFNLPYEINPDVLGDLNYTSYTTFQFVDNTSGKVIASGTRYDLLAKKIGLRKVIPGICANVWIKGKKEIAETSLNKIESTPHFLLHISSEAKTFALNTLEEFWKNNVYVKHALLIDKMGAQIQLAKKVKATHHLIIGHKEALEGNVMIRDAEGKSQKILKPDEVIKYIKKLK